MTKQAVILCTVYVTYRLCAYPHCPCVRPQKKKLILRNVEGEKEGPVDSTIYYFYQVDSTTAKGWLDDI